MLPDISVLYLKTAKKINALVMFPMFQVLAANSECNHYRLCCSGPVGLKYVFFQDILLLFVYIFILLFFWDRVPMNYPDWP